MKKPEAQHSKFQIFVEASLAKNRRHEIRSWHLEIGKILSKSLSRFYYHLYFKDCILLQPLRGQNHRNRWSNKRVRFGFYPVLRNLCILDKVWNTATLLFRWRGTRKGRKTRHRIALWHTDISACVWPLLCPVTRAPLRLTSMAPCLNRCGDFNASLMSKDSIVLFLFTTGSNCKL